MKNRRMMPGTMDDWGMMGLVSGILKIGGPILQDHTNCTGRTKPYIAAAAYSRTGLILTSQSTYGVVTTLDEKQILFGGLTSVIPAEPEPALPLIAAWAPRSNTVHFNELSLFLSVMTLRLRCCYWP
jgi:hypothetical protein